MAGHLSLSEVMEIANGLTHTQVSAFQMKNPKGDTLNDSSDLPVETQLALIMYKYPNESNENSNALMFAIRNEHYPFADRILQVLKLYAHPDVSKHILLAVDAQKNNCVQLLIASMSKNPRMKLTGQPIIANFESKQEILEWLLKFDLHYELLTNRNEKNKSALIQSVTATSEKFTQITELLLNKLSNTEQIKLLKEIEKCNCFDSHIKNAEGCPRGHSLLTFALKNETPHSIEAVVKIICAWSISEDKCEIVLGQREPHAGPKLFPSSLCVAAMCSRWNHIKKLLACLPGSMKFQALLETDVEGNSAMKWILQRNVISVLEDLLHGFGISFLQITVLNTYWKMRLTDLEMSVKAIELFNNERLCREGFLIPKPSILNHLSRPLAMIFYNKFDGDSELSYAEKEAEGMKKAFLKLGWRDDNVMLLKQEWTYEQLVQALETQLEIEVKVRRCSLFVLCITSHGSAGKINGRRNTSGKISKIYDVIEEKLPDFIPKAIIIDACRSGKGWKKLCQKLQMNNTLLCYGTVPTGTAMENHYLRYLAKEIEAGNAPLQQMHKRAKEEAMDEQRKELLKNAASSNKGEPKGSKFMSVELEELEEEEIEEEEEVAAEQEENKKVEKDEKEKAGNEEKEEENLSSCSDDSATYDHVDDHNDEKVVGSRQEKKPSSKTGTQKVQIPLMEDTAKSIMLRNYFDEKACRKKKGTSYCSLPIRDYRHTIICSNCFGYFHLACVGLELSDRKTADKRGFVWYCEYCYGKCMGL